MGRLVGDGAVICYIQDLMIHPDYQHYGIGSAIIEDLIEYVENLCEEGTEIMLDLMCAIGREPFYDDPYRRYRYEDDHIEQPQQEQTSGIAIATMILGIIAVVCMVSCCCTPIAIITGIAAVICFAVTPKVRGTRGNKAKAGLICGIIGIIGSVILITVFVVNILLSSDFQNEMKEFNTHYDTYIDENDDSI